MPTNLQTRRWIIAGFSGALLIALFALAVFGRGERGTSIGLQLTGRFSFLLFLSGYLYKPITDLLRIPTHQWDSLPRLSGVAFASALTAHLALVAWLCWIGATPPLGTFVLFGGAVIFTYLLALNSFINLGSILGTRSRSAIRTIGVHYIAVVFAIDFVRRGPSLSHRYIIGYLPFALIAVAAPSLRLWYFLIHRVAGTAGPALQSRLWLEMGVGRAEPIRSGGKGSSSSSVKPRAGLFDGRRLFHGAGQSKR